MLPKRKKTEKNLNQLNVLETIVFQNQQQKFIKINPNSRELH